MQSKNQPLNKSLLELALKKQFIHGICNFSDRWCERCTKTQHCMSFAYRQQIKRVDIDLVNNDLKNERFWNAINKVLNNDSTSLIKKIKINPTELSVVETAAKYKTAIENWLTENSAVFEEKAKLTVLKYGENEQITFAETIEIIKRYSSLIHNKTERSLKDLDERKVNPDLEDKLNPYRDNVGSAKVAALVIDRSVAAFLLILPEQKNSNKEITEFIKELLQIKTQILQIFPGAMQFIRPGFDE